MNLLLDWRVGKNHLSTVDAVLDFWMMQYANPDGYQQLIAKYAAEKALAFSGDIEGYRLLGGRFTKEQVIEFVTTQVGMCYPLLVEQVLEALVRSRLLYLESPRWAGQPSEYLLNSLLGPDVFNYHLGRNLVFGFPYVVESYRSAVLKIEVELEGAKSMGCGFITQLGQTDRETYVITNRHVVENVRDMRLLSADDVEIAYGDIYVSPLDDLAAIRLPCAPPGPTFAFVGGAMLLDEVISFGYPPVSRVNLYQFVHKGEINALVKDYQTERSYFIYSAKTQPGHSGGPLVNEMGLVVGIVTQDFIETKKFEQWGLSYFAATPIEQLEIFLRDVVLPKIIRRETGKM